MKIWWCQEHGDNGNEERCGWQWVSESDEPCRMVPMRLIPDNAETLKRITTALELYEHRPFDDDPLALAILAALDGETP